MFPYVCDNVRTSITFMNTVDLVIFARFSFSQISREEHIQESRENYYYNSATKEKFANSKFREKSQKSQILENINML